MMKDQLLQVCRGAAANGASSPTMNRVVGGSPVRVSSNRDVYVSQPRTPSLGMTPRTRTLYAFSDTPAQTASEGLRAINQTLNSSSSGTDSAVSPGNRSVPSKRFGLNCLPQRCEPPTYSMVLSRGTGSSGTQNDTVCVASTR